jgi:SAM-dependent methyltransferase
VREDTAPIDPFVDSVDGRYVDDLVVVQAITSSWPARGRGTVRTPHFDIAPTDGRLVVIHSVSRSAISDDLTGIIVDELFAPGWVRGAEMFERIFTGVVLSSAPEALDGWELFYCNTMRRLDELHWRPALPPGGHGTIEAYAPVYAHAEGLTRPGSVLELGCCFGFLSLRLARGGHEVTASDIAPGTVRLLEAVAPRLGVRLSALRADAARVPLADGSADTVLVIHLLEHLDPSHGELVLAEALRCATHRVVVAVPFGDEANESYGHVRTLSLDDLAALGDATAKLYGFGWSVHEHHGGWLVLDR